MERTNSLESRRRKSPKKDFEKDYKEILKNASNNTIVVQTEWKSKGDYIQKLSLFDESYTAPVKTLGSTTFINK
ncbi:MAG TPA: hypothetical protein VJ953_06630 [Saprospiraceae bacterium]|nr:hypothetical protein [Saprospiraceae bacterium]